MSSPSPDQVTGGSNRVTIELVGSVTDDVRMLIYELDRTLSAGYAPEEQHGLALAAIFEPHVRFFVARLDGAAVGCGGIAFFETFGELKRMYVREHARGSGIVQALIARVETEARANGLDLVRLETGNRQHAALRVYDRAGYQACAAFGAYLDLPPRAIANSIFMEKHLAL